MDLREKIESEVKNTIGYSEAENKESFMVGVSVALSKTEDHYKKEIERLTKLFQDYKLNYESVSSDFKTLTSIIHKYSDSNND
jgi:archaellum component FlaC